jgi:hypothetical protein
MLLKQGLTFLIALHLCPNQKAKYEQKQCEPCSNNCDDYHNLPRSPRYVV